MHSIGERTETADAAVLRERISRLLNNGASWKAPLRRVIATVQEREWRAVLFGGVLRDLAIFGPTERPRDVDIVVDNVSQRDFENAFGSWIVRRNRFGGLHLLVDKWMIDIWNVSDTWGIRELGLRASFDQLPKTTFLNVEALAAEVNAVRGQERHLYSHCFFEIIEGRTVDINLEPNPFPALCIVRSLLTAARLDFALSPRLATYIVDHSEKFSIAQLLETEVSHYGVVRAPESRLSRWIESLQKQLLSNASPIRLPLERGEQMVFSNFWCPSV